MTVASITRDLLTQHGLPIGTSLENRVTWRLHRFGVLDRVQYRVGRYRLDYAWPDVSAALEVDGPHHWHPDVAVNDVARDARLRDLGWLVLRINDGPQIDGQLCRVAQVVRALRSVAA
ncbi:DUF559 domain-containing protein [Mycolicibacter sp. MYC123]|uniref:DUF559 domain-containing protein n=1 Tax=[Mycobacterium] zoologicum TaxID=2872311 RepID=A0ABU5YG23_9MYCO|nr:DUF559 domain-containing protein [Mycolicibacter sp. MYC123]MEB3049002.1 DUF559 domain-containing protein [Mycolicibacter sp. MYC123]